MATETHPPQPCHLQASAGRCWSFLRLLSLSATALALLLAACTPPAPPADTPTPAPATPATIALPPGENLAVARTLPQSDGNRYVSGQGQLTPDAFVDIPLDGPPAWVVGLPLDEQRIYWAVALEDGQVQAFVQTGNETQPAQSQPSPLPPGMPPVLLLQDNTPQLLRPPAEASPVTDAVLLPQAGLLAFIAANGDLVLHQPDGTEVARLALNALPDARLLLDEQERLLLYTDATQARYTHGVLGDQLEAASVTLIETRPQPRIAARIEIPAPAIFEGIAPIWTDVDGDGSREIITTKSDGERGAQILVYNEAGEAVFLGPPIGMGNRWRHQLAVAPFGPDGALELADDLTPHIGGVAEFYGFTDRVMPIVARLRGYSTHVIGSRNLDMAVAGDFDGDGQPELLVPDQQRKQIAAIRRTADGAEAAWTLPLGGSLNTNLAAVHSPALGLTLAAGRWDGVLRIWHSAK